jgi:signal peptidase I
MMANKLLRISLILGSILTFGLFACFGYFIFFLGAAVVPTGAMSNTIIPGDHLIVKKRALGPIARGDVIIFKYPRDTSYHYVFRVIGLPSELVEVRGRSVYVNRHEL